MNNLFLSLRLQSGMTQEELSEHSGVSIRTIRKFERGLIERPRRSSVDMLLAVLDPDLKQLRTASMNELGLSPSAAEWLPLADPGAWTWRGTRPPRTSLIGRKTDVEELGQLVTAQQVVVLTGPGGAGKSGVALTVAERVSRMFADGVAVAELGCIPQEQHLGIQAATHMATGIVDDVFRGTQPHGRRALLVLDNAEHLPRTAVRLADRLLNDHPALHILITSRRPLVLHEATVLELGLLSEEYAVELLADRLRAGCSGLDLSDERPGMTELVRRLDRLPRLVEFAAQRLRMMPLSELLTDEHAIQTLGSAGSSRLPHQQTVEASLRWSLDLLDERHRDLLAWLARQDQRRSFSVSEVAVDEFARSETLELLADLADSSLLQVNRGRTYEYRMLQHVRTLMTGTPDLAGSGAGRR